MTEPCVIEVVVETPAPIVEVLSPPELVDIELGIPGPPGPPGPSGTADIQADLLAYYILASN